MARKQARTKREDITVFWVRRDTECGECGDELGRGSWITLADNKAYCLECADLDHLVFLPRGDATLTRRSRKHSKLSAVVVQWSRTRKRYERQGLLVEEEALAQAEEECLADADVRERKRQRDAERREELDKQYVADFATEVRRRYPGAPDGSEQQIAEHACRKYSGRVGRSAAAKEFDERAVALAVRAHIRHLHTNYDDLLMQGWDRHEARSAIGPQVAEIVESWQSGKNDAGVPSQPERTAT